MRRSLLSLVCVLVLLSGTAGATVLLPIEFRELVTSANVIVHGRVVDVRAEWVDGRRAVETFVTIQADEYLKGNLGDHVTFKVPGGQLGRYRTVFVGAPIFTTDDEVVLFLKANGQSFPFIIGLTQGLFRVVDDGATGDRRVTPPPVLDRSGVESQSVVRGDPARKSVPVATFRQLVARVLREAGQGGNR